MSGLDEQHRDYPDCPRCLKGHFWIGKIEAASSMGFKYIYFNSDSYRGKSQRIKAVVVYGAIGKGDLDGRYATKEEIEESYDIICGGCRTLSVDHIVSIIKNVAIKHIAGIVKGILKEVEGESQCQG